MTSKIPEQLRSSLSETIAVSFVTLPLAFQLFGQFSLAGLIINPLVFWILPPLTFLGLLVCLLGWIPFVLGIIRFPLWLVLHLVLGLIHFFASWRWGIIYWHPNWIITLSIYGLTIFGIKFISHHAYFIKKAIHPP